MKMSLDSAIQRLAERTTDRTRNDRQDQLQRRNQVVDLYGIEYTRQGDTNTPATFYISVSPDLVYYERFEFKIIVQPFAMPIGGNGATGSTTVQINNTSLTTNGSTITPNPHNHTSNPHNHSLDAGVTLFTSSFSNFQVFIEDINITTYLQMQFPNWINGEGVYPTTGTENYDLLKAIGLMPSWQQGILLAPGYKKVEFRANGVYNATLVNYLKYSHVNR